MRTAPASTDTDLVLKTFFWKLYDMNILLPCFQWEWHETVELAIKGSSTLLGHWTVIPLHAKKQLEAHHCIAVKQLSQFCIAKRSWLQGHMKLASARSWCYKHRDVKQQTNIGSVRHNVYMAIKKLEDWESGMHPARQNPAWASGQEDTGVWGNAEKENGDLC